MRQPPTMNFVCYFRGIQKNQIIDRSEIKPSVVGAIEAGLTRFRLLNEPCVVPSSRYVMTGKIGKYSF